MTITRWRKSSFTGNQGDCVEIAHTCDEVRDSKNTGVVLSVRNLSESLRYIRNVSSVDSSTE